MIGVFDSGVGGLTFIRALWKILPQYRIAYFGDTARIPYGNKSPETVRRYAEEGVSFLKSQGATVIIIACHTASALAADDIRPRFSVPIFDVLSSVADEALKTSRNGRIGVIGTSATIRSKHHQTDLEERFGEIRSQLPYQTLNVFETACPLFVPLVEEGFSSRPESIRIIRYYLRGLKKEKIDTLVLACTHYPLLRKQIQSVMGQRVALIDSSIVAARLLQTYLESHPEIAGQLPQDNRHRYFVSDDPGRFARFAKQWLGTTISVSKVVPDAML